MCPDCLFRKPDGACFKRRQPQGCEEFDPLIPPEDMSTFQTIEKAANREAFQAVRRALAAEKC